MTISAQSWLDSTMVAPEVFARWPDYHVILVATDHIDIARISATVDELVAHAGAAARDERAEANQHVGRWHQAYRAFGVKPRDARVSVDALLRRAVNGDGMQRINTLVDAYNAISMIEGVPIGGEDLDRYSGPARLILARGDEPFETRANGAAITECPAPGEPVWVDDEGVTCRRWNWRQTTRTAIDDDTVRIGFIIDSLDSPDHRGALAAASRLQELIDGATRVISKK